MFVMGEIRNQKALENDRAFMEYLGASFTGEVTVGQLLKVLPEAIAEAAAAVDALPASPLKNALSAIVRAQTMLQDYVLQEATSA